MLLATSSLLRQWGLPLLAVCIAGGWWARRWLNTEAGHWWRDRMRLRLPLAGPVFLGLAVSRFCRVLGTLLHNGVPILRSLQISRDATGNRVLAAAIGEATENISAGQPLAGPLAASGRDDRRGRAGQQLGKRALVGGRFHGAPHLATPRPHRAADRTDLAAGLGGRHPGIGHCPVVAGLENEFNGMNKSHLRVILLAKRAGLR
jgi:hypothetical protein